ncbi:hypothetical protein JBKA6_0920 [Ichthyobacterium seriolicida]|uniref:Septum formation initiator n=2 Tax=Ichthyobacterium seriolicida TaxID=242600 RepID=A0A1J1E1V4_9FLAO|nr:hypothetical protein JBKA6_0920 [Ichthyobacterium seriolicida]
MSFLDKNSFTVLLELSYEIEKLERSNDFYRKKIREDTKNLERIHIPYEIEKYAREKFLMKRENEDVFIIKRG